jgi:glycosyltransferase involved in cell wall biosynthesis
MLKALRPRFTSMTVAMASMNARQYDEWRPSMSVIDEVEEDIRFEGLYSWKTTNARFARELPGVTMKLARLVNDADLVHSHPSYDLYRPVENIASAFALAMKKKLLAVNDMDNRRDADMNHRLGRWSTKSWLVCKLVYDPIRELQQRALVKVADLMLFKEPQQVEDYGRGAPHVRLFLDPNFHPSDVAGVDVVQRKTSELMDPAAPLRVLYFGRLVPYKGVDKMIEAVADARARGAHLTFDVMGSGPEEQRLKRLVDERRVGDVVRFLKPRPYGPEFFDVLRQRHLLLACPLSADTPRSTWDAFASAMPVLAFNTPFYAGIGKYTGAVDVVPWPEVRPLAGRLVELADEKKLLIPFMRKAVVAAQENNGEAWLKRRVAWVEELYAR